MDSTKFLKGLGLMAAIIFAAMQSNANIWPVAVIASVLTGAVYFISNYWITSSSTQGSLNLADFIKGAILATIAPLIGLVATLWDGVTLDWKALGTAALFALLAYIFPTYFTWQ